MGEIMRARIKSIYGDIKGLLSQIPQPDKDSYVGSFLVNGFNFSVDELTQISGTDYSRYKITYEALVQNQNNQRSTYYYSSSVRPQIGRLISRLEEEYDFGKEGNTHTPNIAIFNKNHSEVSVQINYTLNELIEKTEDDEGRIQLMELRSELEKKDKDWEKIKKIIIWVMNFSKDIFLEILPIILQKKL